MFRGSAHLELTTIRRQILPYCGHLQTTPQDPSFQTVLTRRHQRLCVFGLYGAIQMLLLLLLLLLLYGCELTTKIKRLIDWLVG